MRIVIEQQGPATVVTVGDRSEYGRNADEMIERLAPDLARMLLAHWRRRASGCVRLTFEEMPGTPQLASPGATHVPMRKSTER